MDKYEYNLKLDEIKKLAADGNYESAAKVADTIEWKRVRNIRTLCMVSEIYEANGRLEDSKEILLKAYRRSQMTRTVLFRLTEVAIKMKEFDEAVEYYSEFVNLAPNDTSRYILKYEIYKGRGSSLEDQIAILEEYKEVEYTEQWGYELAKLYYQAGDKKKCVENCDDLVLWFRQGPYVIKALELKKSITALTPVQQAIYDHKEENLTPVEDRVEAAVPELEKIIVDKVPATETDAITDNIISQTQKELAEAVSQHAAETDHSIPDNTWRYTPTSVGSTKTIPVKEVKDILNGGEETENIQTAPSQAVQETAASQTVESQEKNEAQPQAGAYDPIQLQQELANSMREIISGITRNGSEGDIIEPKNDMSSFENSNEKLPTPELEREGSIDDILLSMSGIDPAESDQDKKKAAEAGKDADSQPSQPVQQPIQGNVQGVVQNQGQVQANVQGAAGANGPSSQPAQQSIPGNAQGIMQNQGQGEPNMQGTAGANSQPSQPVQQPMQGNAQGMMQNQGQGEPNMQGTAGANSQPSQPVQQPMQGNAQGMMQNQGQGEPNIQGTAGANSQPSQPVQQPMQGNAQGTMQNQGQSQPVRQEAPKTLTVSQQYQFSYFATIQGLPEQIASALQESLEKVAMDKTSRSGNLVITGMPGCGKSNLAIRFAKTMSLERGIASARIAKIYAEDFNKKDIPATIAKIAGGTLIIEEAGDLQEEVVEQLSKAMEFRTDGLLVILEDEQNYLKTLFDSHPKFAEKFTSEIDIPIMTNDELVSFGRMYAYEEDYRIDDMAMMALYNRISELQAPDHPVTISDVKEIVDEAIQRSERTGIRKLGMILSHKRYDSDDRVILYEKDFK